MPLRSTGITQQLVGFQIDTVAQAYFPGKVNALGGLEVRGNFNVPNTVYITTLQVNANSYLYGDVYVSRGVETRMDI